VSIRFYMDEHVPAPITEGLRRRGVDVLTAQDDARIGAPDSAVLDRATELGRVVFTFDKDFFAESAARQRAGIDFSGVIYAKLSRITYGQCLADLELIAIAGEPEDMANQIDTLPLD